MAEAFPGATSKDVLFGNSKIYLKQDFENQWDLRKFNVIRERTEKSVHKIVQMRLRILQRRRAKRQLRAVRAMARYTKQLSLRFKKDVLNKVRLFANFQRRKKAISIFIRLRA